MSKKSPKKASMPQTPEMGMREEMKSVRMEVPVWLHRRLKVLAAQGDVTLMSYMRQVLEQHVADQETK